MLYVMLGLFVASMAYFILIIRKETKARKQKLMENFGIDLIPYVRYSQASIRTWYFGGESVPANDILFQTFLRQHHRLPGFSYQIHAGLAKADVTLHGGHQ